MAHVVIGAPVAPSDRAVDSDVTQALIGLIGNNQGHKLTYCTRMVSPIDNCRNQIVSAFLKSDGDYLLFIDSDNPPMRNPLELVDLDEDIIALPTPMWSTDIHSKSRGEIPIVWNVFDWYEDREKWGPVREPGEGLTEIDAGGTGCMLIARRVLESLYPAFYRTWNEDGTQNQGSDLLFCKRAKEAGYRVWTHYAYPCRHFKTLDLYEVLKVMQWRDIAHALEPNSNTQEYWDDQWVQREAARRIHGPLILPVYPLVVNQIQRWAKADTCDVMCVLDFGCGNGVLLEMLHGMEKVVAHGVDTSRVAVNACRDRGMSADVGSGPVGLRYDVIVATEVLEHIDGDAELLADMFSWAPRVIYTVPWNCLPPGLEPEHRRVYTREYVRRITPHLVDIIETDGYLVVVCDKAAG